MILLGVVELQSYFSLPRKRREPRPALAPPIQRQISHPPLPARLTLINPIRLKRISRQFSARKHPGDLARIRLNKDQIGNNSLLTGDERQAHQQMPMDSIPLDLDRELLLRDFPGVPELSNASRLQTDLNLSRVSIPAMPALKSGTA
jgi:hypothetical protein